MMENLEDKNYEYIILNIAGGLGKCIMATALIAEIKKTYPTSKIVVVAAWEAAFLNNPNVYRIYNHTNLNYFYNDYVKGKNTLIIAEEVYNTQDFIKCNTHTLEAWCKLANIQYSGEMPAIYLTEQEYFNTQLLLNQTQDNRHIALIHLNGGDINRKLNYSWVRDLHPNVSQQLVNYLNEKGYRVIQIATENQFRFNGAEHVTAGNVRELFSLFSIANSIIGIDSFSNHISAALRKKANILWMLDKQYKLFKYNIHNNIISPISNELIVDQNKLGYLNEYDIQGNQLQLAIQPYEIMSIDYITDKLILD